MLHLFIQPTYVVVLLRASTGVSPRPVLPFGPEGVAPAGLAGCGQPAILSPDSC